jgi:hypothetical protein
MFFGRFGVCSVRCPFPPRRCPLLRTQPRPFLCLLPPLPLGEGWGEGAFGGGFSPYRAGQTNALVGFFFKLLLPDATIAS